MRLRWSLVFTIQIADFARLHLVNPTSSSLSGYG
ncbi:unnamed protein product [Linum tenue]|uniref:Uncharacterized protein n=1 Tax=Linum tenue TaxID=586396 RepID=A0AAV0KTV2_9ROSI|nr:unnamed protein product [Linum tenue]